MEIFWFTRTGTAWTMDAKMNCKPKRREKIAMLGTDKATMVDFKRQLCTDASSFEDLSDRLYTCRSVTSSLLHKSFMTSCLNETNGKFQSVFWQVKVSGVSRRVGGTELGGVKS